MFLPFIQTAQSDPVETITGEQYKIFKTPFAQFLEEEEGVFYIIGVENSAFDQRYSNRNIHLYKYSSLSFSLQEDYVIEPFKYLGHKTFFKKAFSNKRGCHLLFTCQINKTGKMYLLYQKLSKDGKVGEPRMIAEMNDVKDKVTHFNLHFSENNDAILIYEEVMEDAQRIRLPILTMCDQNFDVLWKSNATTPFKDGVFVPTQLEVSNAGELFILGYGKQSGEKNYKACITSDYGIIRIAGKDDHKIFLFKSLDKVIHSASIKPDFKGELLITGFYSDSQDEPARGSFIGTLDQKLLTEINLKSGGFSLDILKKFSESSNPEAKGRPNSGLFASDGPFKGLEFFTYQNFVPQPDGGVIVIGERRYYTLDIPKYVFQENARYTDEILVASFGNDGSLKWLSSVPKRQVVNSVTASYYLHQGKNELYLIFNDHVDNIEYRRNGGDLRLQSYSSPTSSNAIMVAKVSMDGLVSYQQLGDTSESNKWISTSYSLSANEENMLTLTLNKMLSKYTFTQYKFP